MENCIFCKIIKKELPGEIIYEDDLVLAFLDINPASLGHTLIIPKKHFINLYDIESEYLERIIMVAQKIAWEYRDVFAIDNLQLIHNAGQGAQQVVFHFHLHLIPRKIGDNIDLAHIQNPALREKFADFMNKFRGSSNGRTPGSGPGYLGSNPSPRADKFGESDRASSSYFIGVKRKPSKY